ncbi:hypothetical protein ACMHYB_10765 [Sorangium sp. So ce1128]
MAKETDFDALGNVGREVRHTTPWGAVVETDHDGLHAEVTDALDHVTVIENDPLGRPVTVTDTAMGVTRYKHGPFGALYTVTDPGGAITRTARDAFGRVRQHKYDIHHINFTNSGALTTSGIWCRSSATPTDCSTIFGARLSSRAGEHEHY